MRKMHERSDRLVSRIHHVDMTKQIVSVDHDHRETPHSFSKNVLTRDQLNELLDMKQVKKII